jgi:general stress protein 26
MLKDTSKRLRAVLRSFEDAMLVTHDERGGLRARPLAIAACEDDATLWFLTRADSGKIDEIVHDQRVAVVAQGKRRYLSVSGRVALSRDPVRLRQLWNRRFLPWFPGGASDPLIVALRVEVEAAEMWDLRGLRGLAYLGQAVWAILRGARASDADDSVHHDRIPPRYSSVPPPP